MDSDFAKREAELDKRFLEKSEGQIPQAIRDIYTEIATAHAADKASGGTKTWAVAKVFGRLKSELVSLLGKEAGEAAYYLHLNKYVPKSDEWKERKKTLSDAQKCAADRSDLRRNTAAIRGISTASCCLVDKCASTADRGRNCTGLCPARLASFSLRK